MIAYSATKGPYEGRDVNVAYIFTTPSAVRREVSHRYGDAVREPVDFQVIEFDLGDLVLGRSGRFVIEPRHLRCDRYMRRRTPRE